MIDEPFNRRRQLTKGDPVQIRRVVLSEDIDAQVEYAWVPATVISNSGSTLSVAYANGTTEVIQWSSGRIRGDGT